MIRWRRSGFHGLPRFRQAGVPLAALVVAFAACATNPVTGRKELAFVSESQEISMGREYAGEISREMGVYPDSSSQAYLTRIGTAMAAGSERPRLPWTFTVMDDPQVNAFALPGGYLFFTRGILTHMNSEAELASVLGHEIGHVTARHSVQQLTRQQLAQIGLVAGSVAWSGIAQNVGVLSAGLGLLFLKYGRDDESQADGLGFRYALNQGYDVRRMVDLFATLERVSASAGQRLPEWQSTHPDPGNRIAATQARLAQLTVPLDGKTVRREEFLRMIDGMVFGDNPRQGFFRGAFFLHPDLAFQLDFPAGWTTANRPSSVVGVSARKDARVQLALAGQAAPREALRQFLAQDGVTSGRIDQSSVNGNPAARATFTIQSQDAGELAGLVAFVAHGGTTYRLVGLTTAAEWGVYGGVFDRFTSSFRRLTDPAALGVSPNRISLVRVPRAMTLAGFDRQYPSTIALDRLALINGVKDSAAALRTGDLVKRVVGGPATRGPPGP